MLLQSMHQQMRTGYITIRYAKLYCYIPNLDIHLDTQANQVFAERIASVLKPGDLVWVHDYHLLLVPKLLRSKVGEKGTDV